MRLRRNALLPCLIFFARGRAAAGVVNLLLQCTIVLWPFAIHWARRFTAQQGALLLLREFSDAYAPKLPLVPPARRVRGFAAADSRGRSTFGRARAAST